METIGIFFGGKSPEHDISIITGQLVLAGLKELGYSTVPVYISKKGDWFSRVDLGSIDFFRKPRFEAELTRNKICKLDLRASRGKIVLKKNNVFSREIVIDLVFPAFHGRNGEDGTIQGLFELMNVPYVGCGVVSSAVAMDKVLTKLLFQKFNIPTTDFLYYSNHEWQADKRGIVEEIEKKLAWPLFVKPARLGSSIGIQKVTTHQALEFALEAGFYYDSKVLIEKGVERVVDLTCAVLGNEAPRASLVQETDFEGELFDFSEKYLTGEGSQFGKAQRSIHIPARLDQTTTKQIQYYALTIFKMFECSGIARIDFLYDPQGKKIYSNEINTLPGTLYHHLWEKSGVTLQGLLTELIRFAQERHQQNQKFVTTFSSSVLTNTSSSKLSLKLQ